MADVFCVDAPTRRTSSGWPLSRSDALRGSHVPLTARMRSFEVTVRSKSPGVQLRSVRCGSCEVVAVNSGAGSAKADTPN